MSNDQATRPSWPQFQIRDHAVVAGLAVEIGRVIGLERDRLERLRIGGLLHDVGELTIPRRLLCHRGKLSPREFDIVKGHCQAGHDLLNGLYPAIVVRVAWEHHERLDGSGYPRGLRTAEICLEAQVVGIADVAEAMMADRPYRAALGMGATLEEVWRARGVQYDGDIVDACVSILTRPDSVRGWRSVESAPSQ